MPELMTAAEHRAMDLTAELVKLMCTEIITDGPGRGCDVRQFMADIHHIQHRIMKQAAARAYPDRYRLLGGWPPGTPHETGPALTPLEALDLG